MEHEQQELFKLKAISNWSSRTKFCFLLHVITSCILLNTFYWFTSVIGLVILLGSYLYAYSVREEKEHFVYFYVFFLGLNLFKNTVIVFFLSASLNTGLSAYEQVAFAFLIVDDIFFFSGINILLLPSLSMCFNY